MHTATLKKTPLALTLLTVLAAFVHAQHEDIVRPAEWSNLAFGGRFMDRFEPMPLLAPRTEDTWGVDAVKPRDVLNGIVVTYVGCKTTFPLHLATVQFFAFGTTDNCAKISIIGDPASASGEDIAHAVQSYRAARLLAPAHEEVPALAV